MELNEDERNSIIGQLIIANPHYDESYFINLSDEQLEQEYDRLMNKG